MDLNSLLKSQWDRATAIVCTALGALLLLVGWIGVSGTPFLAEQAPYILSGGVGGVFLLGVGATLWISADLRDEWRKLDRIETALLDGTLRFVDEGETAGSLPTQRSDAAEPEVFEEEPAPRLTTSAPSRRRAGEPDTEILAAPRKPAVKAARSTTVAGPKRRTTGVGHA